MGIESDNARDGALSGFFSSGSTKRLEGSRASDLAALGVGWEEKKIPFFFPTLVSYSYSVAYY